MKQFLENASESLKIQYERLTQLEKLKLKDLDPKKTLIISVDMNNGFVIEGALASPRVKEIIPRTVTFLEAATQQGFKIVGFTDTHTENAREFKGFPPHCLAGTAESEIVDELKCFMSEIFPKASTNGLMDKAFMKAFEETYIPQYDNFVITGCCTDICVYDLATTMNCYFNANGLNQKEVIVVKELVETYDIPGVHNGDLHQVMYLNAMLGAGIKVQSINQ